MDGFIVGNNPAVHGCNWASLIMSGKKTAEVRATNTKKRGRVAIISSQTNEILGTVEIYDVKLVKTEEEWNALKPRTKVNKRLKDLFYDNVYVWLLRNATPFAKPIPCANRKRGQVIWVKDAYEDTERKYLYD